MTQWTITKDLTGGCGEPSAEGVVGPGSATLSASEIMRHPKAKDFRMYDDDGVLYYEGVMLGDDDFAPLDDFGEPNAGCTRIDVLENGKWVTV